MKLKVYFRELIWKANGQVRKAGGIPGKQSDDSDVTQGHHLVLAQEHSPSPQPVCINVSCTGTHKQEKVRVLSLGAAEQCRRALRTHMQAQPGSLQSSCGDTKTTCHNPIAGKEPGEVNLRAGSQSSLGRCIIVSNSDITAQFKKLYA